MKPLRIARARRSPRSTTRAASRSRPIRSCPYPLCAQGWVLRRLLADDDPRFRPDAIEAFNPTTLGRPWHGRVVRFAAEHGLPTVGNSDAHAADGDRDGLDDVPGPRRRTDLRAAIVERHDPPARVVPRHRVASSATFGEQLRKYGRDARDTVARQGPPRRHRAATSATPAGRTGRRASRRPGSGSARRRPDGRGSASDEDRARHAVRLPAAGRRDPARPATSTRTSGCAATTSGSSPRRTASSGRPRATSSGSARASRCRSTARSGRSPSRRASSPRSATCSSASSSTCSTSTSRSCRSCRRSSSASRRA